MKKGGGAAFPNTQHSDYEVRCPTCNHKVYFNDVNHPGMTVRQWYKGMSLPRVVDNIGHWKNPNAIARFAGEIADAMIREDEDHEKGGK